MPASIEEIDHVNLEENAQGKTLTLKSYGLPMMFWGYFLIVLALEFAMYVSVSSIISKLFQSTDKIDHLIAFACTFTMILIPLFGLLLLFFQKVIIKMANTLKVEFRFFGIRFFSKTYELINDRDYLEVSHLLESPNMAKIQKNPHTRAFENQGHYILTLWSDGKPHFIDRHTRKQDLEKLAQLIKNLN